MAFHSATTQQPVCGSPNVLKQLREATHYRVLADQPWVKAELGSALAMQHRRGSLNPTERDQDQGNFSDDLILIVTDTELDLCVKAAAQLRGEGKCVWWCRRAAWS